MRDNDIYPRLNYWLSRAEHKRILDLGCGQGVCSSKIDLTGKEYIGVDPSQTLILRGREKYSDQGREFLLGSATSVPLTNSSVDAVFSVSVWHLLEDISLASAEINRVLKPGGRFLIITANPENYDLWTDFYTESRLSGIKFEGRFELNGNFASRDVLYLHPKTAILNALSKSKLSVTRVDTFRPSNSNPELNMYISIEGMKN